ncbi:response regulator transcription factor [Sphingomonas sp. 37zxx]|uniref:response regulator transcription factor n=1 Tax=Sphingomonas sp. 37zxx TaxID=1550073 RepID=UPI00069037C3|nr:helix-turn-helix transcriptional regulator [Sphingomonas sp. 37zxx]
MTIAYRSKMFIASDDFDMPVTWPATDAVGPAELLSSREGEIAQLVAIGMSNKAIGRQLGISHWTVSTHLRRIFTKLDINNRIELCRLVITPALPTNPRPVPAAARGATVLSMKA